MNVFFLHTHPAIAASAHCDKHVGKMLIESCQLLAAAHHLHGNGDKVSYKLTHKNHPSAVWTRSSRLHYRWVAELAYWLGIEFYKRYGKRHRSAMILETELFEPPPNLTIATWSNPPLAMPEQYRSDDAVESYRAYYKSKQLVMTVQYYRGERRLPEFLL
jgi:hypothetical protein